MNTLPPIARGPLVQLVLQPTRFCNIDCAYCYLPDRTIRGVMSETVLARALAFVAKSGLVEDRLEVRWHAGEPLAAGRRFFADAHAAIAKALGASVEIEHSIQTNATLLDAEWCRLLKALDFRVGVSIDGPRSIHDMYRRTRRGGGTFDQAMRGIAALQDAGVPFETISVVTPTLLAHSDEFLRFMEDLKPIMLGLNVEESEGPNQSSAYSGENFGANYRSFVGKLVEWEKSSGIPVRELVQMRRTILDRHFDLGNAQNIAWKILSLDVEGNLYTFSPELAGHSSEKYPSFSIGNVLTDSTASLMESPLADALERDIAAGVRECKRTCAYFRICGGGAPVNKFYEKGTFASSATNACKHATKTIFDAVLVDLENQRTGGGFAAAGFA